MKRIALLMFLMSHLMFGHAQQNYKPSASNLENRKWFEESRFGVFIHWGVYSVLGDGEWVMNNQNFGVKEYGLLPTFFNPIDFDANAWAKLIKDSGAKYVTFTSRHHDGFSMWHTKQSSYNIVEATPFKRDIIKELVEACRAQDIKVMFYYSLLDWKRDDYLPTGKTGKGILDRDSTKGDWDGYIKFMKNQLTELLTNYGRIDGIWFDGHWDKVNANWHYDEIYSLIHSLQPQCLVGNNHHIATIPGEDFQMFERDLPGQNTTGFGSKAEDIGVLPKEVCGTIADSWGFNIKDRKRKSFKEVISYLINAAGHGSNLLLNVGPMPNGKIQDYQQESLLHIGQWLSKYGDAIYGTHGYGGKVPEGVVVTQKAKKLFVHILDTSLQNVVLEEVGSSVKSISSWDKKVNIKHDVKKDVLSVDLSNLRQNEPYVITINLK